MKPHGDNGLQSGGRRRLVAIIETALILAGIPAMWLWFLRSRGFSAFQGRWVGVVVVAVLLALLVVAIRRLSRWANVGWRNGGGFGSGRNNG